MIWSTRKFLCERRTFWSAIISSWVISLIKFHFSICTSYLLTDRICFACEYFLSCQVVILCSSVEVKYVSQKRNLLFYLKHERPEWMLVVKLLAEHTVRMLWLVRWEFTKDCRLKVAKVPCRKAFSMCVSTLIVVGENGSSRGQPRRSCKELSVLTSWSHRLLYAWDLNFSFGQVWRHFNRNIHFLTVVAEKFSEPYILFSISQKIECIHMKHMVSFFWQLSKLLSSNVQFHILNAVKLG